MEMYARYYSPGYDLPISTLFWGAVIFVALVAACLLVGKAIGTPRNRRKFDGAGAVNQQRGPATPAEPITAQTRPVTKPHRRLAQLVGGDKVEGGHIKDPEDDPLVNSLLDGSALRRVAHDESTDMAGFSEREEEEFLLTYGPRKVRKAIRERRNARLSNSQKKQSQS
jgi:hypothetical protein